MEQFRGQIIEKKKERTLDLIDRKLIVLLSRNARFSYTALAKAVRVRREMVGYRLKRLEEDGFLHGYFTLINPGIIGLQMHMIYIKTLQKDKIIEYAMQKKEITRIKTCTGAYDIQLIFTTKTIEEFDTHLDAFLSMFATEIREYNVLRIVEEDFTGLTMLINKEQRNITIHDKGASFQKEFLQQKHEQTILDEKDKKILRLLQHNARMSIADIATALKLAPIAVHNRMKTLIKKGVICSMYPLFAISEIGYQWYKVFVQVKNIDKRKFITYLREHDNVLWYMKLIGKWNYQFSVFAKDTVEFNTIVNDIRKQFNDQLINYDSLIILNQLKFDQRVD